MSIPFLNATPHRYLRLEANRFMMPIAESFTSGAGLGNIGNGRLYQILSWIDNSLAWPTKRDRRL
jgi:hypothetical protein